MRRAASDEDRDRSDRRHDRQADEPPCVHDPRLPVATAPNDRLDDTRKRDRAGGACKSQQKTIRHTTAATLSRKRIAVKHNNINGNGDMCCPAGPPVAASAGMWNSVRAPAMSPAPIGRRGNGIPRVALWFAEAANITFARWTQRCECAHAGVVALGSGFSRGGKVSRTPKC